MKRLGFRNSKSLNHLCNTGQKTWNEVAILTVEQLGATKEQIEHIKNLFELNKNTKKIK